MVPTPKPLPLRSRDLDLLFRVDAGSDCGFGHAARCITLAKLIAERKPNVRSAFQGDYSPAAARRIGQALPDLVLHPIEYSLDAKLVVFDTMFDPQDMNAFDLDAAMEFQAKGAKVLAIISGTEVPELDGMIVVGYQPSKVIASPPKVHWGLQYAPVSPTLIEGDLPARESGRVLVALGGHPDDHFLRATLKAMKPVAWIDQVDILLSPVMERRTSRYSAGKGKKINLHRDVPSVAPLLAQCELAIASYGNLAFEALALGTPLCIVGQKGFQRELARRLEERRLAMASEPSDKELPDVLEELRHEATDISRRAQAAIDTEGLARLADLILHEIPSALSLLDR